MLVACTGVLPVSTPKAEQTRGTIVAAALRLFEEQGYERTTMRGIAAAAGVSVGNAYYYFGSKEHLVQAFYDRLQVEHAEAAHALLARESRFEQRLLGVLHAWVDVAAPHHEFAGGFFKTAADPRSPLSPFSAASEPARETSIGLFREVVAGSDLKVSAELRAELPMLLWLVQMGVVLFWVHDDSPGQTRTRSVIARTAPIVTRLLRLARLPVARGLVDDVVGLIGAVRS